MDKLSKIKLIRTKLSSNKPSIGSWIQLPDPNSAEIMAQSGYDWIAVDLEHSCISSNQLVDIFRSLELHNTLPIARISSICPKECKSVLDSGAAGIIFPMISCANDAIKAYSYSLWPPLGTRGVAFNRANQFGEDFNDYKELAACPLLIGMIETIDGVRNIESILQTNKFDAILIGPYDLSASLGKTGLIQSNEVVDSIQLVKDVCAKYKVSVGLHQVSPNLHQLEDLISEGYQFIPYSIDTVFLAKSSKLPSITA